MGAISRTAERAAYRMRDLVRLTGINRETIHYYLSEGLLPKPEKTSRNMAWYDDEHIERLRLIKQLQEKEFMPLRAIKAVLGEQLSGKEFTPEQRGLIAAVKARISHSLGAEGAPPSPVSEVLGEGEVPLDEVEALAEEGLIEPERGPGGELLLSADDAAILREYAGLRSIGFTPERGFRPADMKHLKPVADLLFHEGLDLVTERLSGVDPDEVVRLVEGSIPMVGRFIEALYRKRIQKFLSGFSPEEGPREASGSNGTVR